MLIYSYFIINYLDFLFIADAYFINLENSNTYQEYRVITPASLMAWA